MPELRWVRIASLRLAASGSVWLRWRWAALRLECKIYRVSCAVESGGKSTFQPSWCPPRSMTRCGNSDITVQTASVLRLMLTVP